MFEVLIVSGTVAMVVAVFASKADLRVGRPPDRAGGLGTERLCRLEDHLQSLTSSVRDGAKQLSGRVRELELEKTRLASDLAATRSEGQRGVNRTEADVANLRTELRTIQAAQSEALRSIQEELERVQSLIRIQESRLADTTSTLHEEIRSRTASLQHAIDRIRPGAAALARADLFADDVDDVLRKVKRQGPR